MYYIYLKNGKDKIFKNIDDYRDVFLAATLHKQPASLNMSNQDDTQ